MKVALVCLAVIALAIIVEAHSGSNNIVQSHKAIKSHGEQMSEESWQKVVEGLQPEMREKYEAERQQSIKFWAEHRYDDPDELLALVRGPNGELPVHPNDKAAIANGLSPKVSPKQIMHAMMKKENPNVEIPEEQDTCLAFCDRHCNDVMCDNWPGQWRGYDSFCGTLYSWTSYTHSFVNCVNECNSYYLQRYPYNNPQVGINWCLDMEQYYLCCGSACCGVPASQGHARAGE